MKEWNEFLNELQKYEINTGISELVNIINMIVQKPKEISYKGYCWQEFTNENNNITLRFCPRTWEVEIQKTYFLQENIKEIVYTYYKIIFCEDMYVAKEEVVNQLTKVNGGYQVLIEGTMTQERFTETGIQKNKKAKSTYCPYFIFRSDADMGYCDFLVPKGMKHNNHGGINSHINFKESNIEYYLSSLNSSIKAYSEEINGFVVFFKTDNDAPICFPAYFNDDKTIMLEPFINDPLFQLSAKHSSGYKDEDISLEGRTKEDANEYINNRYSLASNVISNESHTSLKKTLTSLKKVN